MPFVMPKPLAWPLLLACGALYAQPTLPQIWARHDRIVLESDPKSATVDPACSHTFKGRQGQIVRGWDVGDPKAPVVLWWQGGPGAPAEPGQDSGIFIDPKAYRHLEIDQPGTGQSAWVPGWKPEDTVEDAVAFLKARGVRGPVFVAGWSWGSTMALLFAQRHPELVQGVVIGGVWTNTRAEVHRFLDADGARAWMPGISEAFRAITDGSQTAKDLHGALRTGKGGEALAKAYDMAEAIQSSEGWIPREPIIPPVTANPGKPVDPSSELPESIRFAYIESEMMLRGARGAWHLKMAFPKALAGIPLVVLQGRYDQVCDPEVARRVVKAWPGRRKLLVPYNGGHGSFSGPFPRELKQAGLELTKEQMQRLRKAVKLHFGSAFQLQGAALDCLADPKVGAATPAPEDPSKGN